MNKKEDAKTALIDAELILYRNAARAEKEGTSLSSLVEMTELSIADVIKGCMASEYYLVVSGRNNFRKTLYPDYKAGRPPKPELYGELCNAIQSLNRGRWFFHDQIEADDLLGIMATNGRVKNPIICSIDKDMLGVPAWHYNWNKDDWPREVTQDEADHNWLVQLLKGDPTDNIEGMKGIGDVKAEKLVAAYYDKTGVFNAPILSAKEIYESEGFSLDAFRKCLFTVSIWRSPMPSALLENELIAEICKTIPSLKL
jgi:5'-3' exonuclease